MPAMLAPILGPVVGGAILQNLHWSWIFLVNAADRRDRLRARPGGCSRTPTPARPGALDVLGLALLLDRPRPRSSTASPSSARTASLTAPTVVWPIAIAGLVLRGRLRAGTRCASSARCSTSACTPTASSRAASLTTFGLGAALFGAMILVPLYYQEVRHESVIVTGLLDRPAGARRCCS